MQLHRVRTAALLGAKVACSVALALVCVLPLRAGLDPATGNFVFRRYTPKQYGASPQNWSVVQDSRGFLYFGNNDGLLEFDGANWRLIPLPGNSVVRSLVSATDGKLYVGGVGVFGFLQVERNGTSKFVSLLDRVPKEDRDFADVWRTFDTKQGIFFSSYKRLFLLRKDGAISVWRPEGAFRRAFPSQDNVYVATKTAGLQKLNGSKFEKVPGSELFLNDDVTSYVPDAAGTLIASRSGLFRLDSEGVKAFPTEADEYLAKNTANSMSHIPGDLLAVGTRRGGLVIIDSLGRLKRTILKSSGIPSDYVTSIMLDHQGGIWLTGLENGIVRFNPALSKFGEVDGLKGTVYAIRRVANNLFVGTSAGLFRMQTDEPAAPVFKQEEAVKSSQYALLDHGGELISVGDDGAWAVPEAGGKPRKILDSSVLYDVTASRRDPAVIYAAGRGPVYELRRDAGGWRKVAEVAGRGEDFRSVLEDRDGKVWATTPTAVLKIDFEHPSAAPDKYQSPSGPAGLRTNVFQLHDGVGFTTGSGLMRFSESDKKLVPDPAYGKRGLSNIAETRSGETWISGPGFHALLYPTKSGFRWYPDPLIEANIDEIWAISTDPDGTCWASGEDGILHRWQASLAGDPHRDFQVVVRRAEVIDTKEALALPPGQIPYHKNGIRLFFTTPYFEDPAAVEYQVRLEGADKGWSEWSHQTQKEYSGLFEQSYRFEVRARSPHGRETASSPLALSILPPWYRSWWSYLSYAGLLVLSVWQMIRWRVRKLKEANRKLEEIVVERTAEVCEQRDQIAAQEKKTESLLLNILPAPVAAELRHTGSVTPMSFDDVTVCFTDFVGFTLSSEKLPPADLVDALNEYFTAFDEIVGRYGLEKLKTIGDSYMFVSGLPQRRKAHAVDAVLAALEMVEVVNRIAARDGEVKWKIRIGLHSGPVVAGVVGVRKFAFDIWGNTVNFAARMESSGVPGSVNVSVRTCRLLRDMMECEPRGLVRIKEGRELEMFLVRGPAPLLSAEDKFRRAYRQEFGEELRSWLLPVPADRKTAIGA